MKPTKLSITFFVMLLASLFITMAFAFKQPNPNQAELDRLDEISARLGVIANQQADLSWQIQSLDMQYRDLNDEASALNDEASAIFMKLIDKKNIEIELTGTVNDYSPGRFTIEQLKQEDEWYPGKLTEDGDHQVMPELTGYESHERFKELCNAYWLDASMIYHLEDKYWLVEGLLPAILIAETSWWHNGNYVWSWCYNLGNVNNNDRWDRICFNTKEESIEKVAQTLNNKYLWSIQTLGCLSNAWDCLARDNTGYKYATSTSSWQANVKTVLETIYNTEINPSTFMIRK